jgi:glycosyltransferase involved in cell wall biosynthesis
VTTPHPIAGSGGTHGTASLRVLLDCRMADWSGVGRYTTGLARALARRGDVELVQVVAEGATAPVADAPTVSARRHPFNPLGSLELGRIARAVRPDVTHCTHFMIPFPVPRPLAVTLHDLTPLLIPGVMPSRLKRAVYRHWNAEAVAAADVILANSQNTAKDLARFFPAASGKVTVVLHSAEGFTDGPTGQLPVGLPEAGERYVLSMGNTKPHKDLPTLLRAFARVAPARPGLRLLLVGAGAPGYIAGVLGSDPVASRVAFTGHVDDAVLRALYAGAAVFAFPSLYEGFGLPPLEAMEFGTPVVTSDAASLPEVVGTAALTFPAGDDSALALALARILDDDALAAELRANGPAHAAAFTWERTAAETVAAYRELLGGRMRQ